MRYVIKNWFWISAGFLGTAACVERAYAERGAFRCGGEWLVLPLVLALVETVRRAGKLVDDLMSEGGLEDGNGSGTGSGRLQEERPGGERGRG
ncbi:MAG: hypothetical protein IJU50_04900 [Lachnospiraceae bacterium]|nr:hypothetical protein [Lachnospiraceae bacterium]